MITHRIPYSFLPLPRMISLANRTLITLDQRHPDDPFLVKSIEKLEDAKELASRSISSSKGMLLIKTFKDPESNRDSSFESLRSHIVAGLGRNNKDYRDACERLFFLFKKHNLSEGPLPLGNNSEHLDGLISTLKSPSYSRDIDVVHALDWLHELESDQYALQEVFNKDKHYKTAGSNSADSNSNGLVDALKGLFRILDVAEENDLVDGIGITIRLLNEIIEEISISHQ